MCIPKIHENTIESICEAINLGCHGVEVDIQTTKDNKIILFHDNFIILNNKKFIIKKTNYSKILKI